MKFLPSNPNQHVLVIGAASLDVIGQAVNIPEPGTSNPAKVRVSFGGTARNVAENLARLGQPVDLITAVGKEALGRLILDHTEASGVNVEGSLRAGEISSAAYLAVLNEKSELYFGLDDMAILNHITPDYLRSQKQLFQQAGLVFIDANLSKPSLRTIFQIAQKARIPIAADATSTTLAEKLTPYLPEIYLLSANRAETRALLGSSFEVTGRQSALQAAREFVHRGVEIALIPIGEGGVCYATSDTNGHVPAVLTRLVDSTGAGDALLSATLYGLLNNIELNEAVRLGVTAASLTLTYAGPVLPDLSLELLYENLVI